MERRPHGANTRGPLFPRFRTITFAVPVDGFEKLTLRSTYIPHWSVLLAYGLAWSAAIAWRRHQVNRHFEKEARPVPG